MNIFYGFDRKNIDPNTENISATVERIMKKLEKTNPHLAQMIREYDRLSLSGNDEAKYFLTMLLTVLTHKSTSLRK